MTNILNLLVINECRVKENKKKNERKIHGWHQEHYASITVLLRQMSPKMED